MIIAYGMATLVIAAVGVFAPPVGVGHAAPPTSHEVYRTALDAAWSAKARGDWAAMEEVITRALRHGPGDEYVWRSLAWAQMHRGKWRESLATGRGAGPVNAHFLMYTPDGRHIEGIQGLPVSGVMRLMEAEPR